MMETKPRRDQFRWSKLLNLIGYWPLIFIPIVFAVPFADLLWSTSRTQFVVCFIVPLLVIFLIIGTMLYQHRQKDRQELLDIQNKWENLAQEEDLTITGRTRWPKSILFDVSGARLFGQLEGHRFFLHTWHLKERDFTYIHVELDSVIPEPPIPGLAFLEQDLVTFLSEYQASPVSESRFRKDKQTLIYRTPGILTRKDRIKDHIRLMGDLSDAYVYLTWAGGEYVARIVKMLQEAKQIGTRLNADPLISFIPLLEQLLQDIEADTKLRFADRLDDVHCRQCLTQFGKHTLKVRTLSQTTYYGCRRCGLSRTSFDGQLVAVLNKKSRKEQWELDNTLQVNWSMRRTLFDFSSVEIINATDEDIERFVVQVRNDTDVVRQASYANMACNIREQCSLSANSSRLLKQTFREIVYIA